MRDAFTLEAEEKDIPFFTALVIALDNMCDKKQKQINRISFKLWGAAKGGPFCLDQLKSNVKLNYGSYCWSSL
ncbi:MAG: hypothetical protein IKT33_00270 [Clostridia bacterium]|nr:hypothetical protein [Clostridia bacterium]